MKECADSIALPLYILWKKSFDSGTIPKLCKKSLIVPVFKSGKKELPENYRPVSLTSHIIKIFERVLKNKIVTYLESNKLLNDFQHGFRGHRSCLSQLIEHYSYILDQIQAGYAVDVIYLDYAKAFDKVDHAIVIKKAKALGISGKLLKWLENFLAHRVQTVLVNGVPSTEKPVISGVPQGTVLGPLLFLIMINDMPQSIKYCSISSFADDTKLVKPISNTEDTVKIQEDLINIFNWTSGNNLSFNSNKFVHMRYNAIKANPDIIIPQYFTESGETITTKENTKDLGMLMSNNLKFTHHIEDLEEKCKILMNWALRTFKTRDPLPMLTIWKSLILSKIDYCSQLYAPTKMCELLKIEALQRTFTNYIHNMTHLDYWQRLKELKLYSIERRFERYLIIYIWKILEKKIVSPFKDQIRMTDPSSRTGRKFCLDHLPNIPRSAQTILFNSPLNRAKRLFNKLPKDIRNLNDISADTFKKHLDGFLNGVPDEPGVPGYTQMRTSSSNSLMSQINFQAVGSRIQPVSVNSVN